MRKRHFSKETWKRKFICISEMDTDKLKMDTDKLEKEIQSGAKTVFVLQKSICGLVQAARQLCKELYRILRSI